MKNWSLYLWGSSQWSESPHFFFATKTVLLEFLQRDSPTAAVTLSGPMWCTENLGPMWCTENRLYPWGLIRSRWGGVVKWTWLNHSYSEWKAIFEHSLCVQWKWTHLLCRATVWRSYSFPLTESSKEENRGLGGEDIGREGRLSCSGSPLRWGLGPHPQGAEMGTSRLSRASFCDLGSNGRKSWKKRLRSLLRG